MFPLCVAYHMSVTFNQFGFIQIGYNGLRLQSQYLGRLRLLGGMARVLGASPSNERNKQVLRCSSE